jgi:2-polyprenyl-3-methyl-5-hydroxy-6-metoxy-1,4-benzoquinol methylase
MEKIKTKRFEFKPIDEEGLETLEAISKAEKFNLWMFDTIAPFCQGKTLEIGSGIGNISNQFVKNGFRLTVSDIRDNYCSFLSDHFHENVDDIVQIDIVDSDFNLKHQNLFEKFDTVFALNIVEHVEDDILAIENCKKLLKPGGNLIILVPAYESLYNNFDKELEHYKRYTIESLSKIFIANNLKIIHKQYFNFFAIFGWWFSGSVLRKKTIPNGQMKLFNLLVPVFKLIDKILFNKIGISAIVVGKK